MCGAPETRSSIVEEAIDDLHDLEEALKISLYIEPPNLRLTQILKGLVNAKRREVERLK